MSVMNDRHPAWVEFLVELEKEAVHCRGSGGREAILAGRSEGLAQIAAVLHRFEGVDVEESLESEPLSGQCCPCEVMFNVASPPDLGVSSAVSPEERDRFFARFGL